MLEMNPDPRHPQVLVVDDDADTRELYHIMLEGVGYRVESAGNVRAASELAARTTPHVVLTDWRLPDGDGFAVCDALRGRRASRNVPIIAVSGLSMPAEMAAEAHTRGFTSIIVKPASPDDILRAVHRAYEIGTARRLHRAAVRLRRYATLAARHKYPRAAGGQVAGIDAGTLVSRAAARSGGNITIVLADDSAHYVAAGGGARDLTGYDPQELVSLSVWDLTPPPDATSGQGLWRSFIAAGTQEGRYILRRRDGAPVEAQYCAIANVIPGLHVSAIAEASRMPASL
jgi:CheY-like chemotaxis protein